MDGRVARPLAFLAFAFMSQMCMAARIAQEVAEHSESNEDIVNVEDHGLANSNTEDADNALAEFTDTTEDADNALAEFTNTSEDAYDALASPPDGFTRAGRGRDCRGHDIPDAYFHGLTRSGCATNCAGQKGCVGFSWNPAGVVQDFGWYTGLSGGTHTTECHLKNRCCTPEQMPARDHNWEFFPRQPDGYTMSVYDCKSANIITRRGHQHLSACARLCTQHIECRGFSYGPDGECKVRGRASSGTCQTTSQDEFTFYVKDLPPLKAQGEWIYLGVIHDGYSDSVETGTVQTSSHSTSHSATEDITTSLSSGFEVEGASVSGDVTESVGTEMSSSAEFSQSTSASHTTARSFSDQPGGNHLWQWRFNFYRWEDECEARTFTASFAQTAGRWQQPACLPGWARDPYTGYQDCASSEYQLTYE